MTARASEFVSGGLLVGKHTVGPALNSVHQSLPLPMLSVGLLLYLLCVMHYDFDAILTGIYILVLMLVFGFDMSHHVSSMFCTVFLVSLP